MVLPERNRGDLDDVPEEVRDAMKFHFAMTIDEVLGVALEQPQVARRRRLDSRRNPHGRPPNPLGGRPAT